MLTSLWRDLGGDPALLDRVFVHGPATVLPSVFDVTGLAAGAVGAAALALAELAAVRRGGEVPAVDIDRIGAALAFRSEALLRPIGWELPAPWDPLAGDYRATDGWIRLHTNYAHHRAAALGVLGCEATPDAVAAEVARRAAGELEAEVVDAGGCAAAARTTTVWRDHPQGRAVAAEPLVGSGPDTDADTGTALASLPSGAPALAGVRVLDLTRVIAGPVATRFLAAHGADVLRLDPPGFDEVPALVPDVTVGKRCAALDLRSGEGRTAFGRLVAGADVLVTGLRPGALDAVGFDLAELRRLQPALVVGRLDAYGWTGPWAGRRGFDSLVQMSSGIALAGAEAAGVEAPRPLPAQALDHGTGFLLAAAVLRALTARHRGGPAVEVRLSLARTAQVLLDAGADGDPTAPPPSDGMVAAASERGDTAWGPVVRARCPGAVAGEPVSWPVEAGPLGRHEPAWA